MSFEKTNKQENNTQYLGGYVEWAAASQDLLQKYSGSYLLQPLCNLAFTYYSLSVTLQLFVTAPL